jgi:hypothetical protein
MKLNMKFKMTPLVIFMILLIVLVISMFIGSALREGLSESLMSKKVNDYSANKDLYVLHENILFDNENGNLVEIQGTDASDNELSGEIFITPRSGSLTYIADGTEASNTKSVTMGSISPSHASWEYPTQTTHMSNKNVYYIGWDDKTYLMVHNKDENKLVGAYLFDGKKKHASDKTETPIMLSHYRAIDNAANKTLVSEPLYSEERDVYQISENVKYDFKTADLIVKSGSDDIKIYRRGEGLITTDANVIKQRTNVTMSEFAPLYALDELGQNVIVYLPYKQHTMVVLLGYEGSASEVLVIKSISKFSEKGVEGPNAKSILELKSAKGEEEEPEKKETTPDITSEDYILKTQIVPPVCPTCPSCPKDVTCTNCGGQGGSGTMDKDGKSLVKDDKKQRRDAPLKTTASDIVGGTGEVAGEVIGGVGEVAGKSVEVVGDVAGKTIDTADSLVRDTAGAATGLVKDTAGAATGLVKDTASGLAGLFKMTPTDVKEKEEKKDTLPGLQTGLGTRTQHTALPSKNHRTAEFDYMGAVPRKKPSQFMPLTADFSAFAK